MKKIVNYRACGILYNFLKSNSISGKVLIPANICETVPATYIKAGLEVVFFDISKKDFMPEIDIACDILKSDNAVTVLHYNHTYGFLDERSDNELFESLKKRFPKLIIIDDRCLCIPSLTFNGLSCFADMYLYSTGHVKYADIGYGGFAYIKESFNYENFKLAYNKQDEETFDRHIKLCHSNHSCIDVKILTGDWLNNASVNESNYFCEIDNCLKRIKQHKIVINRIYGQLCGAVLPEQFNTWRCQILVNNQEECMNAIFDNGLFASKHYMSLGNGYFDNTYTPNAEWLESHIINLFNDFRFDDTQAERVVEILGKIMIPVEINI